MGKIWLPFPVSIFHFSAKFNYISEDHDFFQLRDFCGTDPGLRHNCAAFAAKSNGPGLPFHAKPNRTMNYPASKLRPLGRCFRGFGVGQNFILPVALGLLGAFAGFFAPAARAAYSTNAAISILVVAPGDNRPSFSDFMSRLRLGLTAKLPNHVAVYRENLDLDRFIGDSYRGELEDWLRTKYHGRKLDVIVASGESASDFILKARPKLWPQASVVIAPATSRWNRVMAGVAQRLDGRIDTHS